MSVRMIAEGGVDEVGRVSTMRLTFGLNAFLFFLTVSCVLSIFLFLLGRSRRIGDRYGGHRGRRSMGEYRRRVHCDRRYYEDRDPVHYNGLDNARARCSAGCRERCRCDG